MRCPAVAPFVEPLQTKAGPLLRKRQLGRLMSLSCLDKTLDVDKVAVLGDAPGTKQANCMAKNGARTLKYVTGINRCSPQGQLGGCTLQRVTAKWHVFRRVVSE